MVQECGNPNDSKVVPAKVFGTLDTMPGNILLAATGAKTLYIGYPPAEMPAKGSLVWLTSTAKIDENGTSKRIRIPVIVDSVGQNAPRSKLTAEELNAAGYRDDTNLELRLNQSPHYLQRAAEQAATRDMPQAVVNKLFMDMAPASRIHFHLATPQELKELGASVSQAHEEITSAFAALNQSAKLEGRGGLQDAIAFAKETGIDLIREKLAVQTAYSNGKGGRSQAA